MNAKKKKPKIVFLDAGTVNFGDVPLGIFNALGHFKTFRMTRPAKIPARIRGAAIVITNKCRIDRRILEQSPDLKCICVAATGTNNIDLKAAAEHGVAVTNVAGYSTETVTQFTFAFILALAGRLIPLNQASHDGTWSHSPFPLLPDPRIREVFGKTLGILGYGAIGKRVARIAKVFGMKVLVGKIPGRNYSPGQDVKRLSLAALAAQVDFLSIHAPLTPLTAGLINWRLLCKMKPSACLINMARGGIVNETDLRRALQSGRIAGAATDVLTQEPPPKGHVLLKAPHLLMTPHVAWASREARTRLVAEIAENMRAFLQGKRRNRVV